MDTFFIIPHTHWEGAVFKTREEYLEMGLTNIMQALQLLKDQPYFRFVLDQACYVEPFLERFPEEEAAFRQYIAEGRLAIAGGLDVMTDGNMPSGESFVRQVLYGKGYFRRKLDLEVTSCWLLDTFGENAQMPQLLKLAGYNAHWFWRGIPGFHLPAEFLWEGLDGTQIPAYWLPYGYGITWGSPQTLPEFSKFFQDCFARLEPFFQTPNRVGLAGVDVSAPEMHLADLVEQFNQTTSEFKLKIATPAEYEAAIEASGLLRPVVRGEMNPIFQGGYSSRIILKQLTRQIEGLLTAAEKIGVISSWLEGTKPETRERQNAGQARLWQAWEPALFNQVHDLMSGVMTDHVYEDTLHGYDYSRRIALEEIAFRLEKLVCRIDTRFKDLSSSQNHSPNKSIALVVFNPSGTVRTDIATVDVGLNALNARALHLTDSNGDALPVQIIEAKWTSEGNLVHARIAFIASNVPAMGYSVYHLSGLVTGQNPGSTAINTNDGLKSDAWLENEYYRLVFDPANGAIINLTAKEGKWQVLAGPGNVIAMEEDHGDLWELYRPLDGASTVAMTERHEAPAAGKALLSTDPLPEAVVPTVNVKRGPVLSEYTVERPFSSQGRLRTTVRLYSGLKRIDIKTSILNNDRFVRYRVLFPTTLRQGVRTDEITFGALQRPDGIELPAQNWIDYSDDNHGVALLNRGLPGNNIANGTLLLSLMRSTCIVAYGFGGGYEPGMSSDTGYELGKEFTFDYALVPHLGSWQEAHIYQEGQDFNQPYLIHKALEHPGELPNHWGSLEISHPNILISALKPGEAGGVVLRLYEACGAASSGVKVQLPDQVSSAEEVNLMEDLVKPITINDGTMQLDFHSFEIKTIRLI